MVASWILAAGRRAPHSIAQLPSGDIAHTSASPPGPVS
jgi:hypothetical protein